jgi:serine/threonine protein kinase
MQPLAPAGEVVAGHYILIAPLGEGKFGIVWRAEEMTGGDREFALKFLPSSLLSDEHALRSLHLEAKLTISLDHPHLMRVHNLDCHDENPFLVMELLRGPTLAQIQMRRGRLNPEEARAITVQVCEGLEHAHGQGIIHLDIKPSNLMLAEPLPHPDSSLCDPSVQVKITDFGIARMMMGRTEEAPRPAALGTLTHMSPELIRGEEVDQRSDIYSLGCVLHQLVAGHPPFQGQHIVRKHFTKRPEPIPCCPETLWQVIAKCLEKEPSDRFQSARELRQALLTADPPRPRRLLPLAAVCAVLTLGLAAGTLWLPKSRTEAPAPPTTPPPATVIQPEITSPPASPPQEAESMLEEFPFDVPFELAALETPPEPEIADLISLPPELMIIETEGPEETEVITGEVEDTAEEPLAAESPPVEAEPVAEETETESESPMITRGNEAEYGEENPEEAESEVAEMAEPEVAELAEPDEPEPVETAIALPMPEPSAESTEIASLAPPSESEPEAEEEITPPEPETRRQRLRRILGGLAVGVRDGAVSVGEDLHETAVDVRDYIRRD